MRRINLYHITFLLLLLTSGCTGLKHVTPGDPIFAGNVYEIKDVPHDVQIALNEVDNSAFPRPNERFLWMRPAVSRYNMLSDSGRAKKFWKKNIATPVLLSQVNPERMADAIENRLFHSGYFYNTVQVDTSEAGKKRRKYIYTVALNQPYLFGTVEFPEGHDSLLAAILNMQPQTKLVKGDIYTLDILKGERKRIDENLKEIGYLNFNPDFISFIADSVSDDHVVNIRMFIKPEIPPESKIAYTIANIYVNDNFDIANQDHDTIDFAPYYHITADSTIKFKALKRGIFIEPNELYSRSKRIQTIRYLNNLAIIQSASVSFVPGDEAGTLDAIIYIAKRKQYAYSAEFNAIFRSTNYFGPGIILGHTNRNNRRNAEQLKINLTGRFELQIADGVVNPAYELGLVFDYTLPRFIPAGLNKYGRMKLPSTTFSAGYNLFHRVDLYRLNSVFLNYKLKWHRNDRVSHTVVPVEAIFTQIPESSISEEFRDYIKENPGVRRSFEEQFIVGFGYEFAYDPVKKGRHDYYFRAGIDLAGNLLSSIYSVFNAKKDSVGRFHLLGVPFSQYIRPKFDIVYAYDLSRKSRLVTRFTAGVGIPFGNSTILPYLKQFYVGGTNSLRSFIARSLGPGNETPPEGFNDITGDLRLEWNLEYRFTIAGKFKGALFSDIGNIWLFNDDPARPGGVFRFNTFVDQLAMSAGWGLRWDFEYVVARLDFAYSIRVPYLPEGEKWISDFKIFKPTLNIAIGYPF